MLLKDRTAIIYGASGAVGGAVARAFAREGARVILAARRRHDFGYHSQRRSRTLAGCGWLWCGMRGNRTFSQAISS